jgi:hypothetical protein
VVSRNHEIKVFVQSKTVTIPSRCAEACRCKYADCNVVKRSSIVLRNTLDRLGTIYRHATSVLAFEVPSLSDVVWTLDVLAHLSVVQENATIATGSSRTDTADTLDDLVVGFFISRLLGPNAGCSDHSLLGNWLFLYVGLASRKILGDLDTAAAGIWIMTLYGGGVGSSFTGNRACVVRSDTSVDWLRRRHLLHVTTFDIGVMDDRRGADAGSANWTAVFIDFFWHLRDRTGRGSHGLRS